MKLMDLTGQRFGALTVLGKAERHITPNGSVTMWECKCDCGNIVNKSSSALKYYAIPSCGCKTKEARSNGQLNDLTGQKFGRLTVMYRCNEIGKPAKWHCKCDCGNECEVFGANLAKKTHSTSCGCYNSEATAKRETKHGYRHTKAYRIWCGIKGRCNNPNNPRYHRYGGRGIKMCKEWEENAGLFCEWLYANGYREDAEYGETTIERKDNDKGYSPDNCRIAPIKEQCNNRSTNIFIEHNGERKTLAQWRDQLGISQWKAYHYLVELKYTIQQLIDEGIA